MSGSEWEVAAGQRYRVGYALKPKKVESFVQRSLLDYAKQRAIDLVQIDFSTPLQQQGPFHCIIHKVHTPCWTEHLRQFSATHPDTIIIDPPELVHRLHNRVSMLEVVTDLQILDNTSVGVPRQVIVIKPTDFDKIEELGLRFPLISKPLAADGGAGSHDMCLVFDRDGLRTLSVPRVVQEFVNHGGVVFKIYVAGRRVNCVKRKSVGDISEERLGTLKGALPFSRVSNSGKDQGDAVEKAEMPPQSLVDELTKALRETSGLHLFNVDLIRDVKEPTRYLIIDINYFPGYEKLPSYEPFITDFLLDVVSAKAK
ncbi:unnamed protein product [Sphenostylis stenocarpa]|uniref:Inositol-tetrakisphosphate 1-kinase n=1 Tax=Sphenostylis stenocarpa TaxID=92480 RepID=A0AA86SLI1_9FABA|nr:unnamed protein product [Sphenostylis stenocarpa]